MKYDFNKIINRNNTKSLKYDFAKERGRHEGILCKNATFSFAFSL